MPQTSALILSPFLDAGEVKLFLPPTLICANGMRMPESSMQMLCARRCSTNRISLLLVLASRRNAVFSRICR